MTRILFVITDLDTGGAEMMLCRLLAVMPRDEIQAAVVSLKGRGALAGRIEAMGIPLLSSNVSRIWSAPAALWRLRQMAGDFKPDIVQGWMYHGNLAALLATPRRVPLIWNIRQSLYDLRKEKRLTALLIKLGAVLSRRAGIILYNSRTAAAQHEAVGYRRDRTRVVPNGFDCQQFKPMSEARVRLVQELRVDPAAILIGSVARYHPMKDHANFLRAAKLLIQGGLNAAFVLAGRGVDNSNVALVKLVDGLGLSQRVFLLGERQDVAAILPGLDIFSTASAWGEGFPNVVGEAMACGVPCAVTDVGDSAWLVGDAGKIVPPGNPQALASAWRELVDMGAEERSRLGMIARRRIEESFNLPLIIEQYFAIYRNIPVPKTAW